MCGIVGIINHKEQIDKDLLFSMTSTLKHRGPDGDGYLIGEINQGYRIWHNPGNITAGTGNFALGHRRLSIIDLATGNQPMVNEDGQIIIVFNGEIYNFLELRRELQSHGHRFSTDHSDTETIIHAYEQWGTSCLQRLRGMFAFGLIDLNTNQLFLARDRLGKKPLYYFLEKDKLIFASELKAIVEDPRVARRMDHSALVDFMILGYIPSPETIYQNIYKLRPAHFAVLPIDKLPTAVEQHRYWRAAYEPDFSRTEEEWLEEIENELNEAVRMRMISDVPLGAFLSGGIDSTAIVRSMANLGGNKLKTFSIGFKEEGYSETHYARQVAKKYRTEHHEKEVLVDALELLPKLVWQYDEPFGDASAIPTYYVAKMAKEHITVALSGDGGDEIFAGYQRYLDALRYTKADAFTKSSRSSAKILAGHYPTWLKGKGFITRLSMPAKERYMQMVSSAGYAELINDDLLTRYNHRHPLAKFWGREPNDYLSALQLLDIATYLPESILVKVDRAAMSCSLETRAPLLDHKVVELLCKVPSKIKITNGSKKYLLKKTISKDWDEGFLERKKMGFGTPLERWFKSQDVMPLLNNTILAKNSFVSNLTTVDRINKLLDYHLSGSRDFSADIWRLLFLEAWAQVWKPTW